MPQILKDSIAYILDKYPKSLAHELSNARLTKMVYLADWHFAQKHGKQITNIKWYFDTYGPFVKDIEKTVKKHSDLFDIKTGENVYAEGRRIISLKGKLPELNLSDDKLESLNFVIKESQQLHWDGFIKMVYSTYPIRNSERYSVLNLETLAKDSREERQILEEA